MRAIGLVSLLSLVTACSVSVDDVAQKQEASTSAAPSPSALSAGLKVAGFSVDADAKPFIDKTPLPGQAVAARSGELLVKFRTPLPSAQSTSTLRGASAGQLADAARARLPGLTRHGLGISHVQRLHEPRVRKGAAQVTPPPVAEYLVRLDSTATDVHEAARKLAAMPEVEWAEPNYIRRASAVPDDALYQYQWHLPSIGAPAAWDVTKGRKHIVVAILDSGVEYGHPDLAANIWSNIDENAGDGIDNDANGFIDDVRGWNFDASTADPADVYGHGTHVAGIVAAASNNGIGTAGVAWNARIMAIKASNDSGQFTDAAIVGGIHYAVDNGADVINMSFGGPVPSQAVREALRYAAERDVVLVAAAGNDGGVVDSYPAAHPEVIAVAALDESGALASYSNFGTYVDVAAPGSQIVSTLPGGWGYASGTSMAAPVVAGLAALAKSAHPDFNADAIRYQVVSTASDLNASNAARAHQLGSGKVNAQKAVGARSAAPWVSLLQSSIKEVSGDNDGEFEAGEALSLSATLGGFADAASVTVSVASTDPWLVVSAPAQSATVAYGGTTTKAFQFSVKPGGPPDYNATVNVTVQSGALTRSWPVKLSLTPTFRNSIELPPQVSSSLLKLPNSQQSYVFDNLDWPTNGHWRVYGTIRQADGSFGTPVLLSNAATDAAYVRAYADASGSVHAVFRQFDVNHDNPKLYYRRYQPSTSSWSAAELVTAAGDFPNWFSVVTQETIAVDAQGRVHVSWYDFSTSTGLGRIITSTKTSSGWVQTVHFSAPGFAEGNDQLLSLPNGNLGYFFSIGQTPVVQYREWNGTSWSPVVQLSDSAPQNGAKLPFVFDGQVYRFQFEAIANAPYRLARKDGAAWTALGGVAPSIVGSSWTTALSFQMYGTQHFATLQVDDSVRRFVQSNGGLESEIPLSLHWRDRAYEPLLVTAANGHQHAFIKGSRLSAHGLVSNSYTSYLTTAPVAATLRPTRPTVVDSGASSASALLTVSWSVPSGLTPEYYRLGVGTAPGKDDVRSFARVAGTSATLDLEGILDAGRSYYFSVRAVAPGFYESEVGSSDGILYNPVLRCTADVWKSSFVYSDIGTLVTYNGSTYRSQWNNSGVTPTPSGNGPWKLVGACSGQPALSACDNPVWSSSTVYQNQEVVNYNGYEYLSLWYSQGQVPTGQNGSAWRMLGACSN